MSTCPKSIYQRHIWSTATPVAGEKNVVCFRLSLTVRKKIVFVVLPQSLQNLLLIYYHFVNFNAKISQEYN
jgi:hypothetical protein